MVPVKIVRTVVAAAGALLFVACAGAFGEGLRVGRDVTMPGDLESEEVVVAAARLEEWPRNERLVLAPVIDLSMLSDPAIITEEHRSHSTIELDGTACGLLDLEWRSLRSSEGPVPTELPEEHRAVLEQITANMTAQQRQQRFDRALEDYRRSKATFVAGSIRIKMVVAVSNRAAHEWLIFDSIWLSNMPPEAIARGFAPSARIEGLGDIAFKSGGMIRFVRGNVAVVIRGGGNSLGEIETLAAKIDAAIAREPAIPELEAVRPRMTIGALRLRGEQRIPSCPVSFTVPPNQRIVSVRAWGNGTSLSVKDGEIDCRPLTGRVDISVSAVTDRLTTVSMETVAFVEDE